MKHKILYVTLITLLTLLLSVGGATAQQPEGDAPPEPPDLKQAEEQLQAKDITIQANVSSKISYQGVLKENGSPVNDSRNMEFELHNDSNCTSVDQTITDITPPNPVPVNDGVFGVELAVNQDLFNGQGMYLRVKVEGDTIINCQEILTVPYALSLKPGAQVIGNQSGENAIYYAYNTATSGASYGVYGRSASSSGRGVFGEATAYSGTTMGVAGISFANNGRGVYGGGYYGVHGYSSQSFGTGVFGQSASGSGTGVYGQATVPSGTTYGVRGESRSSSGRGVYGEATATSGTTYGVRGESRSSSGRGVYGEATATSGTNYGVYGISSSSSGRGVFGTGTYGVVGSGTSIGISGVTSSISGVGVRAQNASVGGLGNIIEGYDILNLKFKVSKSGSVYADGNYYGAGGVFNGGADLAEYINASETLESGDVVEVDPLNPGQFRKASVPYSTLAAGVVSTDPAIMLANNLEPATDSYEDERPLLALAGRVPVKVSAENGAIQVGDLLTTSATPGHAMRCAQPVDCIGAVVGKALGSLDSGTGVIETLVTLQ